MKKGIDIGKSTNVQILWCHYTDCKLATTIAKCGIHVEFALPISVVAHNTDLIDSVYLITNGHWLSPRRLSLMAKDRRKLAPSLVSGRQEQTKHVFRYSLWIT